MKKTFENIYTLAEKPTGRGVSIDTNGIYHVEARNDSTSYKRKYNRFVTEASDSGAIAKIREQFNTIQASAFSTHPHIIARILSKFATPTPAIKKYGLFLDIGCSSGLFLSSLPSEWQKYGIEISERACEIAKERGLQVTNGTLEDFKTTKKFDFIRASHVIEHVTDYEAFLRKTYQLMNPGATFIIYSPNSNSVSHYIFRRYWEGFYDATHFTIFDLSNLEKISNSIGFKTVNKTTYEIGYWPASLIRTLDLVDTKFGSVLFWILLLCFYPIGIIGRFYGKGDALYLELRKEKRDE